MRQYIGTAIHTKRTSPVRSPNESDVVALDTRTAWSQDQGSVPVRVTRAGGFSRQFDRGYPAFG